MTRAHFATDAPRPCTDDSLSRHRLPVWKRLLAFAPAVLLAACVNIPPELEGNLVHTSPLHPEDATALLRSVYECGPPMLNGAGVGTAAEVTYDAGRETGRVTIFAMSLFKREAPDSFWNKRLGHDIVVTKAAQGSRVEVIGTGSGPARYATYRYVEQVLKSQVKCNLPPAQRRSG